MTAAVNELTSCGVSDAMAALGMPSGVITGILPMGSKTTVAGLAFPVRFVPASGGGFNDYLEQVPTNHVVVIDAGGRTDLSVWGGLIALEAQRLGISGTVIHGACRDVAEFHESGVGVFARASTPRSGRGQLDSVQSGQAVDIQGIQVSLRDLVVADRDGVVVVPGDAVDTVLDLARSIEERDQLIARDVRDGISLAESRKTRR